MNFTPRYRTFNPRGNAPGWKKGLAHIGREWIELHSYNEVAQKRKLCAWLEADSKFSHIHANQIPVADATWSGGVMAGNALISR
jgi:hypothetical protein